MTTGVCTNDWEDSEVLHASLRYIPLAWYKVGSAGHYYSNCCTQNASTENMKTQRVYYMQHGFTC